MAEPLDVVRVGIMISQRSPYDGKPYYCRKCGLGFAEYMACGEDDCELETEAQAKTRWAVIRR